MKKYPKNLADIVILTQTIEYLYDRADSFESRLEDMKSKLTMEDEGNEWLEQEIVETEAKMNAYIRLAEKLAK